MKLFSNNKNDKKGTDENGTRILINVETAESQIPLKPLKTLKSSLC